MFTGLIEEIGIVKRSATRGDGIIIEVGCSAVLDRTKTGDSISINGACQTVTELSINSFSVYASKVTASITTLGSLRNGMPVNLERAMMPQSRFGGHFVQGHVDGTGSITSIGKDDNGMSVDIEADADIMKYIVHKGSISVDGISLTVVDAGDRAFTVYLIPETHSRTIATGWKKGTRVNIEVDILSKYVEKILGSGAGKGNKNVKSDSHLKNKLMEEGFI